MKLWIVIGIFAAAFLIFIQNAKSNKTHVVNLKSSGFFGDIISTTLLTEGSSGEVYFWIEQDNKMMCPKSIFMQKNVPQSYQFQCSSLSGSGTFKLVTSRHPDDWVRQNALAP